jgi:outer membrane protein OmpA-like peptidoglycan-associated protein
MFLKNILYIGVFVFFIPLYGSVYELTGHTQESYTDDIQILRQKIAEDPDNLDLREQLVQFLYVTENFEEVVVESAKLKRVSEDRLFRDRELEQKADYLSIISLANQSKYSEASSAVDRYIATYNPSDDESALLRHRQQIYRDAEQTQGYPSAGTKIAENWKLLGTVESQNAIIRYNEDRNTIETVSESGSIINVNLPDFSNPEKIINIAINSSNTLCAISYSTGSGTNIKVYYKRGGNWSSADSVGVLNVGSINSFPSFFPDGQSIVFCTNRNAETGIDIYYSSYSDSNWSEPQIVSGVNTPKDEASIYILPSGTHLFFSSNGRTGLGGFDLFSASVTKTGNSAEISSIVNVSSINTFRNEIVPPYSISDSQTAVFIHSSADSTIILQAPYTQIAALSEPAPVITTGTFTASSIEFDTGSATIRQSSNAYLNSLYEYLNNNPSKKITIAGHTDTTGSEVINSALSLNRARAVSTYLQNRGIDSSRITVRGLGSTKPLDSNTTVKGRQKNRRVEITIYD